MQTQNFILKCLQKIVGGTQEAPKTLEFLNHGNDELEGYQGSLNDIEALSTWFEKRACYYAYRAAGKMMTDPTKAQDVFSKLQAFDMKDLCQAYHETYCISTFKKFIKTVGNDATQKVFEKVLLLYIQNKFFLNKLLPKDSEAESLLKDSLIDL